MDLELLRRRAAIIRRVRSFFDDRGYLETDTPLLAPALIPESCLEVFETRLLPPPGGAAAPRPLWLVPSPEVWMKRIIARHRVSVYQVSKSFRNCEPAGAAHSPEFTMLEFYTMNAGYRDSLRITESLFEALGPLALGPAPRTPFRKITVGDAFRQWAGFDLYDAAGRTGGLEAEARRLGPAPPPGLATPALYDLIFVHAVEPRLAALPPERPVALLDYPAFAPCLARASGDGRTVERWELYAGGIELANCYAEETGAAAVRRFVETEAEAKRLNAVVPHQVDGEFAQLFRDFPRCSGVAMGLDRVVMALTGRRTIDAVLPMGRL